MKEMAGDAEGAGPLEFLVSCPQLCAPRGAVCIGMEPYSSNTLTPHKRMAKRLVVCLCLRSKHAAAC